MPQRPTRSLKHEYELFVEEEIENYKESIPRNTLLGIGDEAARYLAGEQQMALTELLLCEEVDRIIFRRLRLPSYQTWRRRRVKLLAELRRPERWGLQPDDVVVRAVRAAGANTESRVLVAGSPDESSALYLAANGCEVTAIGPEVDALRRVLEAAAEAGLAARVHGQVGDLRTWRPDAPLNAVLCSSEALAGLSRAERARVIAALQSATLDGGVHLVQAIAAGHAALSLDELRSRYTGWQVSVEQEAGAPTSFVARKEIA